MMNWTVYSEAATIIQRLRDGEISAQDLDMNTRKKTADQLLQRIDRTDLEIAADLLNYKLPKWLLADRP